MRGIKLLQYEQEHMNRHEQLVRVCAKNAGGGLCEGGGVFAGHYGSIFQHFS